MLRANAYKIVLPVVMVLVPLCHLNAQPQSSGYLGTIIQLGFEGADVRSVLTAIGEHGDVNIVPESQVTGQVTMQLRRVTWIEALEAVMAQLDLISIPDPEVLKSGLPDETRFIEIMRRNDFNVRQQQAFQQERDLATSKPLDILIIPLNHSRAAEMQTAVQPLVSTEGLINAHTPTNRLIVRDYPENLVTISNVVQSLDIPVRQVRIEAKLLEVDTDKMLEMGFNWSLSMKLGQNENPLIISGLTNLGTVASTVLGNLVLSDTNNKLTLDATIAAMQQVGVANVVATPSISVLDNARGRVFMGEQVPLRQLDNAGNVVIQLEEVGTELVVTPHIVQGDRIILELIPTRASFRIDPATGVIITKQAAETTVEVRDGETAVIGGLKSVQIQEAYTGIPILMDIPIIGALFRFHTRQEQARDLILFVTPHIQREDATIVP